MALTATSPPSGEKLAQPPSSSAASERTRVSSHARLMASPAARRAHCFPASRRIAGTLARVGTDHRPISGGPRRGVRIGRMRRPPAARRWRGAARQAARARASSDRSAVRAAPSRTRASMRNMKPPKADERSGARGIRRASAPNNDASAYGRSVDAIRLAAGERMLSPGPIGAEAASGADSVERRFMRQRRDAEQAAAVAAMALPSASDAAAALLSWWCARLPSAWTCDLGRSALMHMRRAMRSVRQCAAASVRASAACGASTQNA